MVPPWGVSGLSLGSFGTPPCSAADGGSALSAAEAGSGFFAVDSAGFAVDAGDEESDPPHEAANTAVNPTIKAVRVIVFPAPPAVPCATPYFSEADASDQRACR
jgi:hypothetical protein